MSRFYVPRENICGKTIFVEGEEAHHILKVKRLKESDQVVIFDGTGREFKGFIQKVDPLKKTARIEISSVTEQDFVNFPEITLAQAIPKKKKMDLIVKKSTELGVSHIIPLLTKRTIVKPDASSVKKMICRWEKLSLVASKQCGRRRLPEIKAPKSLNELISSFNTFDLVLFAALSSKKCSLKKALKNFDGNKILVVIGPEGGFSEEESNKVRTANCSIVNLGERILRSDTAGIFLLSIIGYEFLPEEEA